MREAQALGVQQHAMHTLYAEDAVVATIAVAGIANHVVRQVLEMPADLPEAPGLRLAAQQRVARAGEFTHRHRQLAGGQALEIGDRRLLHRLARPTIQVMVHPPRQLGRPAPADRQVVLGHFATHQRLAQRTGGLAVEGQQQAAAGGPVQAVHEEDRAAQLLAQAVGQEVVLASGQLAVVDHQPGGLVDHSQALVQVQQLQGHGFSLDRGEGVRFGTHRRIIGAGH